MAVFLRPGLTTEGAPRTAKVKVCRRQPPEAARSGLDGSEHGRKSSQNWDGNSLACDRLGDKLNLSQRRFGRRRGGGKHNYKSSRNVCSESPASFIIFFSSHRGNSPECTATTVVRRVTGCRSVTWLPFCRWNSKPARSSALIISFAETFGSRGIPTQ